MSARGPGNGRTSGFSGDSRQYCPGTRLIQETSTSQRIFCDNNEYLSQVFTELVLDCYFKSVIGQSILVISFSFS